MDKPRTQGLFPWLRLRLIGVYLMVWSAALATTATLVAEQHIARWQSSVAAGMGLIGHPLFQALQERDSVRVQAMLSALSRVAPFSRVDLTIPADDFELAFPEQTGTTGYQPLRSWLTLWPYTEQFGNGRVHITVSPDPGLLKQRIYADLFSHALIITGLMLLLLAIHGLHWQWSIRRPMQLMARKLDRVNLDYPPKNYLDVAASQRIMQEMGDLAVCVNRMLDVIDQQQQNRRQAEEQLKAHQRNLSKIVQSRTAELVELNKRFVQQQFDAKSSALEAKQARWEAEKANQDKTRFLAAASHDLRQPLHAMSLFVEALGAQLSKPAAITIHNNLKRSLETMKELFNALLDISKLEAGVLQPKPEVFPVQLILDRLEVVYRQQAIEKNLDLRIIASQSYLDSDPHLLEQVISNLVSNAIKYTEKGFILVGCKREGSHVRFLVWDSGPGIPAKEHAAIFKEFVQLDNPERDRSKGLGLGLSIVKRTCQLLKHEIRFRSRPQLGTRFEVMVPRAEKPVSKPAPRSNQFPHASLNRQKVLVIDDDAAILLGMKALLESWNLQPILARSIEDALRVCHNRQLQPDLIISDLRLEKGVTGVFAIHRMQSHFGTNIPAILITGDTSPERIKFAYDSPFPLLHKPIRPAQLRSVCTSVLQLSPQTTAMAEGTSLSTAVSEKVQ